MGFRGPKAHSNRPQKAMVCPTRVLKRPIEQNGFQTHRVSLILVRSLLGYSMLLLAVAQPRSLQAQYLKYEGQPVVNIRFEPAEQPLEGAELFDMLPLKRDQPLRMSVVRASVERLFATGRYRAIR